MLAIYQENLMPKLTREPFMNESILFRHFTKGMRLKLLQNFKVEYAVAG
jgi:hypothetical protein